MEIRAYNANSSLVETRNTFVKNVFIHSLKLRNYIQETKILKEKIMWNFLINISARIISAYSGSPFAKQMVATLAEDLKSEGQRLLPTIVESIKEAAGDDKLSANGKLAFVTVKTMNEVPTVAKSLVNSLIDLAYRTLKNDPNVPEVPNKPTVPEVQ